jgi:hypothetical protein
VELQSVLGTFWEIGNGDQRRATHLSHHQANTQTEEPICSPTPELQQQANQVMKRDKTKRFL